MATKAKSSSSNTRRAVRAPGIAPRAASARYDAGRRRVVIELKTGYAVEVPIGELKEVASATASELATVEVLGAGNVLHWGSLDADYSIPALILRAVGTTLAAKEFARIGGRVKSDAKAAAARLNGKKGGRPRSTKTIR
jgi:hypothetical protein